jgi:RNA polymerase sigma-70 factor (ECF subfamily)
LHSALLRMERAKPCETIKNPIAFLTRTAINIRIDNHRHDDFLRHHPVESALCFDHPSPLPDQVLEARARLERLREGLEQLAPRTRQIFLMYRLEEMKYREIAAVLGISASSVEKHVAKAVPFLAAWMKGW